jgi:hypothetical protein
VVVLRLRGGEKVRAESALVWRTHNLLKVHRVWERGFHLNISEPIAGPSLEPAAIEYFNRRFKSYS